jgi:hypothetical protein
MKLIARMLVIIVVVSLVASGVYWAVESGLLGGGLSAGVGGAPKIEPGSVVQSGELPVRVERSAGGGPGAGFAMLGIVKNLGVIALITSIVIIVQQIPARLCRVRQTTTAKTHPM